MGASAAITAATASLAGRCTHGRTACCLDVAFELGWAAHTFVSGLCPVLCCPVGPLVQLQECMMRLVRNRNRVTMLNLDLDPLLYERFFFKENWFVNVVGTWKHPPSSMDFALG